MSENRILYSECLRVYNIDESFAESLFESGLIQIFEHENERFVELSELDNLEQFMRWYYDMNINVEGIEALYHILGRMRNIQTELETLKNELSFYKSLQ